MKVCASCRTYLAVGLAAKQGLKPSEDAAGLGLVQEEHKRNILSQRVLLQRWLKPLGVEVRRVGAGMARGQGVIEEDAPRNVLAKSRAVQRERGRASGRRLLHKQTTAGAEAWGVDKNGPNGRAGKDSDTPVHLHFGAEKLAKDRLEPQAKPVVAEGFERRHKVLTEADIGPGRAVVAHRNATLWQGKGEAHEKHGEDATSERAGHEATAMSLGRAMRRPTRLLPLRSTRPHVLTLNLDVDFLQWALHVVALIKAAGTLACLVKLALC